MKKKLGKLPLIFGVCLLGLFFSAIAGNNIKPNQGKALLKGNMLSTNPSITPIIQKTIDGNHGTNSENKPYDTIGLASTPRPNRTTVINITGKQFEQQSGFDAQRAESISTQLAKISEIKQISTVVNKNTAIIGYSPNSVAIDTNSTKNKITDMVKQIDPSITNVIITDSLDISSRIGRLSDDIKGSRPLNELNNEFDQLKQGVIPNWQ